MSGRSGGEGMYNEIDFPSLPFPSLLFPSSSSVPPLLLLAIFGEMFGNFDDFWRISENLTNVSSLGRPAIQKLTNVSRLGRPAIQKLTNVSHMGRPTIQKLTNVSHMGRPALQKLTNVALFAHDF